MEDCDKQIGKNALDFDYTLVMGKIHVLNQNVV